MKPRSSFAHITVLKQESAQFFKNIPDGLVVDCTGGGGGHSQELLDVLPKSQKILILDRDLDAVEHLREHFSNCLDRVEIQHESFGKIGAALDSSPRHTFEKSQNSSVSGIIADLGLSNHQLRERNRGFSFQNDSELDMRMNQSQELSAYTIVNEWSEQELVRIFYDYGEEPKARQIARAITATRSKEAIGTCSELAAIAAKAARYPSKSRKHPATKTFQAIRMAVNNELGELESLLEQSLRLLRPQGRLAIITFHSLEDRIVKHRYRIWAGLAQTQRPGLRGLPFAEGSQPPKLGSIIKPFPLIPSKEEITRNPQARSAKLRVFEKGENP